MREGPAPIEVPATTFAALVWPVRGSAGILRGAILCILGACILTVSAKVSVPGPIPMTLQTLAVLVLGAVLGMRLAVGSVAVYLAEGAAGLSVFAATPPQIPGFAYLQGPTGGFLIGFAVAAAIVGFAADRGLIKRPVAFGIALALADAALLGIGFAWLVLVAKTATGTGFTPARAFEIGIRPFLLAEGVKIALAAVAVPLVYDTLARFVRR